MSFLSPWFLLGALALIVPVLIHLRRREPQSRIPFASVLLLRRLPEPVQRRRRVHHWILFLVRSLAVLLLVLAFARPYWRGRSEGGHSETAIVLLVDTSFSMRYGARFSRAQEKAEEVLARAPEGARVGVVGFSTAVEVPAPLSFDREKARAAVRALRPTFRATDYARGIRAALALLEHSGGHPTRSSDRAGALTTSSRGSREMSPESSQKVEKLIYLISDFQRSGWQGAPHGYSTRSQDRVGTPYATLGSRGDPVEVSDLRLPQGVRLVPVPVASEEGENRAILDVRALSHVVQPRYPERLSVRVGNFQGARTRATVRLFVNDRLVQEQEVVLEPEAIATVEFADFPLDPGFNRVRVELDPDRLPEDDRFVLVIRRQMPKPILVLDGSPARTPSERASFYVQNALLADETFGPDRVLVRSFAEAKPEEIASVEALLLIDPPSLGPTWDAALREFITRGGGLILALGSRTDARAFNSGLGSWLGVRIEGEYSETRSLLTAIETDHPIFRPFADPRRANLSGVRFYGYTRLALESKEGAALILARFHDGGPALVEIARGRGKVLVLAFGLDARRSTLPLTPLYAPLVHQMLASVIGSWQGSRTIFGSRGMSPPPAFRVGETVVLERAEGAPHGYSTRSQDRVGTPHAILGSRRDLVSEMPGIVYAPDGERLPVERPRSDAGLSEEPSHFTPERVGFYRVRRVSGDEPIAVNVEAGESDVRPMEEAELARVLASLGDGSEDRVGASVGAPASKQGSAVLSVSDERALESPLRSSDRDETAISSASEERAAWRMLLVAALLLLLSEIVLAERPRGRRGPHAILGSRGVLPAWRHRMGASSPQEGEK